MVSNSELIQSILSAMVTATTADDALLDTEGVHEILQEMDGLASELKEVLG